MVSFRITDHSRLPNTKIVEILVDGEVAGTIYPKEKQIRIISAHFQGAGTCDGIAPNIKIDDCVGQPVPIPEVIISFDPQPYHFSNGRMIKESSKDR